VEEGDKGGSGKGLPPLRRRHTDAQGCVRDGLGGCRRRVSLEELKDLKRRYGISIAAIMRRALDLGLINPALYRRFCIIQKTKDWHHREPGEYPGVEASSRFEKLVLRALSEEIISMSKGAALLGAPIEDLSARVSDFA
jgi:hypothetical protein